MKENKRNYRLIVLVIEIIIIFLLALIKNMSIKELFGEFWFTSGLLLIILLTLVDQPFYSKDANIFINASTAFVSLFLLDNKDSNILLILMIVYLLFSSYILMFARRNPLIEENMAVQLFSKINRVIGNPKFLFSLCFLYGIAIKIKHSSNFEFEPFLCFWAFILIVDYLNLIDVLLKIFQDKKIKSEEIIGSIMGVEGNNIYLVKIYDEVKFTIKLFDQVIFTYDDKNTSIGVVIDLYFLEEKQWAKVMCINTKNVSTLNSNKKIMKNLIYKSIVKSEETLALENNLVGIVSEKSMINKLSFIYNTNIRIEQGKLVKVNIDGEEIIYQVINGVTNEEILEEKNKKNNIIVEAIQLGIWNEKNNGFDKYGWVPIINTPVYIVDEKSIIKEIAEEKNSMLIGKIPNSYYPVFMDIEKAISHHFAIFGVTGTGKSVFARSIIDKAEKINRKIIIFDFTKEYKISYKSIMQLIEENNQTEIFNKINSIYDNIAKNFNKKSPETRKIEKEIMETLNKDILKFLLSKETKAIVEFPDIENSEGTSEYLKYIFKTIFNIAKSKIGDNNFPQCLIVLEEAHTIIPEWNFVGEDSKTNTATLNAIAQIALQGRKYNVGLMVIAQRTANVSKTILTQCNTVISFQEFDRTSMDFLSNYFGEEYSKILPSLKFRQALACGKAFKSTVPMIFEVPQYSV